MHYRLYYLFIYKLLFSLFYIIEKEKYISIYIIDFCQRDYEVELIILNA